MESAALLKKAGPSIRRPGPIIHLIENCFSELERISERKAFGRAPRNASAPPRRWRESDATSGHAASEPISERKAFGKGDCPPRLMARARAALERT